LTDIVDLAPVPTVDAATSDRPMPALYLGHGAPPLLEDPEWMGQLNGWAAGLPKPTSILIVSAHWQTAPMALSATRPVPLVYDFYGFPEHYYELTYDAPGAPELAAKVKGLMPSNEPVLDRESRGLDHGAWVPLKAMFPDADVPVLQMSMPDLDPKRLFEVGQRLAPLRDEGVLIIGSGFLTHGLPFIREFFMGKPGEGARDALCASNGRALRAAVRDPGGSGPTGRRPDLPDRRLRLRALEAFVRGGLSARPGGPGALAPLSPRAGA